MAAPATVASPAETNLVNVPKQALAKSVIDIGNQCGLSIVFPSHLLRGQQAGAIDAQPCGVNLLKQLTENLPLTVEEISPKAFAIVAAPDLDPTKPILRPSYFEEITVQGQPLTGSRLSVNAFDTSAPVDLITAPELANSGAQTLVEFLKFTPAVAGNSTSTTVSNGGNGTAKVTLRGLPGNNTLVLINGRRVAGDGLGDSSVDLNTIAPAAVERIEIYTDGASAIYGSDAIAGVVNIVLKEEIDGTLVEQYYGISSRSDLKTTTTNFLTDIPVAQGSLILAASIYEQDGLYSRDRDFSASADARSQGGADLRSTSIPNGRIELPGGNTVTIADDENGNPLPGSTPNHYRPVTDDDRYNYNEETSSTSPSQRHNLYLSYRYQFNDDVSLHTNASYAQTEATITLAPLPLFTTRENPPITVAEDNVYNPFGFSIPSVNRRLVELGNRQQYDRTRSYRYNIELEKYTDDLLWNLHGFWSRTNSREKRTGLADLNRVARALGPSANCLGGDLDGCVPLNVFGPAGSIDQAQVDFIATDETTTGTTDLRGIGLEVTGSGFELPAGSSEWAVGLEWRLEQYHLKAATSTGTQRLVGGTTTVNIEGSRRIGEFYTEYHLPLLKNVPGVHELNLELAGRFSHYSDFGNNTSPKIGLKYHPTPDWLVRATLGRGFRAPSLEELHLEGFATQAFLDDPCSGTDYARFAGCTVQSSPNRTQYLTIYTGDENLDPEKSDNRTLGVVWTPKQVPGFRFAVDWFDIKTKDLIDTDPQRILDGNALGEDFEDLVVRDDLGNISVVFAPAINQGNTDISGYDINFTYLFDQPQLGTFELSGNAVYVDKFTGQYGNDDNFDFAGVFISSSSLGPGSIPKRKASTGLEWTRKNLQLSYSINYLGSMLENIPLVNSSRRIKSWTTHNLQLNYQIAKPVRFTLGVDNLFDRPPPFVASTLTDNFDAFAYNPKQRYWYFRVGFNL